MKDTAARRTYVGLHAFQRDILLAIARIEQRDETPKGTAIHTDLEDLYDERLNHARVYQNLNQLADAGLVTKESQDARTNTYHLTDWARRCLRVQTTLLTTITTAPPRATGDGGGQ